MYILEARCTKNKAFSDIFIVFPAIAIIVAALAVVPFIRTSFFALLEASKSWMENACAKSPPKESILTIILSGLRAAIILSSAFTSSLVVPVPSQKLPPIVPSISMVAVFLSSEFTTLSHLLMHKIISAKRYFVSVFVK